MNDVAVMGDLIKMQRERQTLYKCSETPMTRQELASFFGVDVCCFCRAVKHLLDNGLARVVGKRKNPATGRMCEIISCIPNNQLSLFDEVKQCA